jgi:hypothetical protein
MIYLLIFPNRLLSVSNSQPSPLSCPFPDSFRRIQETERLSTNLDLEVASLFGGALATLILYDCFCTMISSSIVPLQRRESRVMGCTMMDRHPLL